MAKKRPPQRGKNMKADRKGGKKKVSVLVTERVEYIDYKDVNLLRRFMSDRAKIRARRVTGNTAQQQAEIAMAIKVAREMALLPYANRITTQRGGGRGGRGRDRDRDGDAPRPDGPPPRPNTPPPPPGAGGEEGAEMGADNGDLAPMEAAE